MSEQETKSKGMPVFDESKMIKFNGVQISAVNDKMTPARMKEIADSYDPEYRRASLTITHEKTGKLKTWAALGWIKRAWVEGEKLMSDFLIHPILLKTLKEGFVRTWSIGAFYDQIKKTMYLDHLAFLGAELPYVPNMPDLTYSMNKDVEFFEFSVDQNFSNIVSPGEAVEPKKSKKENSNLSTYTKEQVDEMIKGAVAQAKLEFKAEHDKEIEVLNAKVSTADEKVVTLTKEKATLEGDILKLSKEVDQTKIDADVNALIGDGRIQPKQKDEISLSLTKVKELGEESYNAQLGIYKNLPKIEFGMVEGIPEPGNGADKKKKFSIVDGISGGGGE